MHLVNVNWNGMSAGKGYESLSNIFPDNTGNTAPPTLRHNLKYTEG